MPVTIGTVNSTVEMTDPPGPEPATVERIVALVLARLKQEQAREKRFADEARVPDRMSERTTD